MLVQIRARPLGFQAGGSSGSPDDFYGSLGFSRRGQRPPPPAPLCGAAKLRGQGLTRLGYGHDSRIERLFEFDQPFPT